jgi:hypothetical protein
MYPTSRAPKLHYVVTLENETAAVEQTHVREAEQTATDAGF